MTGCVNVLADWYYMIIVSLAADLAHDGNVISTFAIAHDDGGSGNDGEQTSCRRRDAESVVLVWLAARRGLSVRAGPLVVMNRDPGRE